MKISVEKSQMRTGAHEEVTVIHLQGKLGFEEREDLEQGLRRAFGQGSRRLIADLSGVDFLSSDGLAALIAIHNRACEADGWLRIVCGEKCPFHVFEKTHLVDLFDIRRTMDDALTDEASS